MGVEATRWRASAHDTWVETNDGETFRMTCGLRKVDGETVHMAGGLR